MFNYSFSRHTRSVLFIAYYWLSLYGEGWAKKKKGGLHREKFRICGIYPPPCAAILKSNEVQEWTSCLHPQQNPVSVSLQSTRPGENVSLLWLHIKIQKISHGEFIQTAFKSTTCIHCSIVFKMNGGGAALGFLGIKSIHGNHSFAPTAPWCWTGQQIQKTKLKLCGLLDAAQVILVTLSCSVCSKA